jgi:hypothetical protein
MEYVSHGNLPVCNWIIDVERSKNMVRLRVYLTLALALLLLANGAWTPANHTDIFDSLAPDDLVAVDRQAIQSKDNILPVTNRVMRTESSNSLAVNSNKPVDTGTAHVKSVELGYQAKGHYFKNIYADVLVLDQYDHPVRGATVYSRWYHNSDYLWDQDGVTDKNGHARLGLSTGVSGTWKVCVVGIEKPNWDVDEYNLPICKEIYVP